MLKRLSTLLLVTLIFGCLLPTEVAAQATIHRKQQTPPPGKKPTPKKLIGSINGHEWVDLGLPSGIKWATCNVGASSPEKYGDFFAWGETYAKYIYDEEACETYGKDYDDISWLRNNGYIDAKGNLTMKHDAARANWGGTWRMPTNEEIEELVAYTIISRTKQNGVYGFLLTSKVNGMSIFFPAAGYQYRNSHNNYGGEGYYRSSTLYDRESWSAYVLYFDSDEFEWGYHSNYSGLSVRAVTE